MKRRIPPWEKKGFCPYLLRPMGVVYGAAMQFRNWLYDRGILRVYRLPIPVVSVGNLSVGGTGKTPLVIEIARMLTRRNPKIRLGILCRGYRRNDSARWVVSDGDTIKMTVAEAGDEPYLIAKRLPGVKVFVGVDRVAVARRALSRYDIDLLILDDAFQHRRICRDVDIVVVDGERGLEGGKVLPAGPLREFPRNIRRASCLVLSRFNGGEPPGLKRFLPPGMPVFKARQAVAPLLEGVSGENLPTEVLSEAPVWAVCGIAHPESFLATLHDLGARVEGWTAYPDHHAYTHDDFEEIARQAGRERAIVTTEKDWVKWKGSHPFKKVYVVSVRVTMDEGEEFCDFIESFVYNREKGVQGGQR